ncbi:MAG TPA: hypothetical protein ENJ32_03645, partial [Crenotrichaceae bacterium]|nr:hypothetical protein [Crenotrichaceae bacterium]
MDQEKYSNLTLAGQTANDKGGVHLTNTGISPRGERSFSIHKQKNMILRYFDTRYNWQWWLPENGNQQIPSFRVVEASDLIIDHISSGWSAYGLIITDARGTNRGETGKVTVQRSLMHENVRTPLSSQGKHNHNVGMLLGLRGHNNSLNDWNKVTSFSIHKNAFIGVSHRLPNTAGGDAASFSVVNNFIYGFTGDGDMRVSRIGGNSWNDFINNSYQEAKYSVQFATNNLLGFQFGSFMTNEPGMPDTKPNFYINGNIFIDEQENLLDITSVIENDPRKMTFVYATSPTATTHNRGSNLNEQDHRLVLRSKSIQNTIKELESDPIDSQLHEWPVHARTSVSILPASEVKSNVLSNVGGNVRFHDDGSTYIDDPVDQNYINWAINNEGPEFNTQTLNDGGIGDMGGENTEYGEFRFKYPEYASRSVNLDDYDSDRDGMPNAWELEHGLNPDLPENNAIRHNRNWFFGQYLVRNVAGYTNLEMYLADIGGDFHMLAKTEGVPINNRKDDLVSVAMPKAVNPGTTAIADVKYSARKQRQIKCFFRKNSSPWTLVAMSKVTVKAGAGT